MYVNTKKLLDLAKKKNAGLNEFDVVSLVLSVMGVPTGKINRTKIASGRFISLGDKSTDKLYKWIIRMGGDVNDIISIALPKGEKVLTKTDVLAMPLKETWTRGSTKEEALQEEAKTPNSDILAEILATLKNIEQAQEETCKFIKTLVFALNGEPQKKEGVA